MLPLFAHICIGDDITYEEANTRRKVLFCSASEPLCLFARERKLRKKKAASADARVEFKIK
jgi:hypothetical protein